MHHKPLVIANWKMNQDGTDLDRFLHRFIADTSAALQGTEVVVCPSYVYIERTRSIIGDAPIQVGAQDVAAEERGAYTGEVAARQLSDVGCSYVLVGHSERRALFGEDATLVNRKAALALRHRFTPVICIGETAAQKEAGQTKHVVEAELQACLEGISPGDAKKVVITYEPVWAVSTSAENSGVGDTPESAQVVHKFIRRTIESLFGASASSAVRIIYGGSVRPENVGGYAKMEDIDGVLVGAASLEALSFSKIVKSFIPDV